MGRGVGNKSKTQNVMVGDKYRPLTKFITMGRGLGLSQIVMGGRGLKNDTD